MLKKKVATALALSLILLSGIALASPEETEKNDSVTILSNDNQAKVHRTEEIKVERQKGDTFPISEIVEFGIEKGICKKYPENYREALECVVKVDFHAGYGHEGNFIRNEEGYLFGLAISNNGIRGDLARAAFVIGDEESIKFMTEEELESFQAFMEKLPEDEMQQQDFIERIKADEEREKMVEEENWQRRYEEELANRPQPTFWETANKVFERKIVPKIPYVILAACFGEYLLLKNQPPE